LPWTKYGRENFGWLAVWVLSPDCLSCKLEVCNTVRRLGEAAVPGGGECRPCPDFDSYTLAFALLLRKIVENLSQGNRRVLGCSAPNTIRLVDFTIAGNGLNWPAGPCCPWLLHQATGSTLSQRKYLPSCHTRGFPTSANFESKLLVRALVWSANSGTPRPSCICLLLTYQGAPVVRRRHLDCNTCSLQTWVGQWTSMQGTHSPSWGR